MDTEEKISLNKIWSLKNGESIPMDGEISNKRFSELAKDSQPDDNMERTIWWDDTTGLISAKVKKLEYSDK